MSGGVRLRSRLLAWFDREKRELPWRGTKDPYAIWVSEVMLQQTTVQTVLPRYPTFLKRFPTVRALARARLDAVLAAWSGLGYYARARNLHRAARLVVERHGGRLPRSEAELRALPGVGEYMAQAVAAIAFGTPALPMEANIRRVVSRLFATAEPAAHLAGVLSSKRPGDSVAALFDLGQTICKARRPNCAVCPVSTFCRAWQEGTTSRYPVRAPHRPLRPFFRCAAAVVSEDGRFLVRRRPSGWLEGMWELPGVEGDSLAAARTRFRRRFRPSDTRPAAAIEQPIAGRKLRVEVYRTRRPRRSEADRWMSPSEIEKAAAPSLTKKIVRRLAAGSA